MVLDSLPPLPAPRIFLRKRGLHINRHKQYQTTVETLKMHLDPFYCGKCDWQMPHFCALSLPLPSLLQADPGVLGRLFLWGMLERPRPERCRLLQWADLAWPKPSRTTLQTKMTAPYLPSLFPELSCYPWLSPRFFLHRTWTSPQYISYISIFLGVCFHKDSDSCSYCYQLGLYYLEYIRKPKITLRDHQIPFLSSPGVQSPVLCN